MITTLQGGKKFQMYTKVRLLNFKNELLVETHILTFDPPADVVAYDARLFVITNVENTYKEAFATGAILNIPLPLEDIKVVVGDPNIKKEGNSGNDSFLVGVPNTMDEAVDALIGFYSEHLVEIEAMTEDQFISSSHHAAGQFIRNSWYLWWSENHDCIKWPKSKPGIVAEFNELKIVHADDMSGILMTLLYRKIKHEDPKLEEQIKKYHDHWKKAGFPDGIPK